MPKPMPLVEVDTPTPIEDAASGPISLHALEAQLDAEQLEEVEPEHEISASDELVEEEQPAPGALLGGYRPSSLRLIDEARNRGIELALASTTSPQNIEALLHSWYGERWSSMFAAIGAGDVVPRKKPDPGIYQYVLDRLGVAPDGCVAVEDSAAGLAAANGAGVEVVVARSEYFRHQSFEGALAVLDDARKRMPDSAQLQIESGRVHEATGNVERAERSYRAALALDPSSGVARARLASIERAKARAAAGLAAGSDGAGAPGPDAGGAADGAPH